MVFYAIKKMIFRQFTVLSHVPLSRVKSLVLVKMLSHATSTNTGNLSYT